METDLAVYAGPPRNNDVRKTTTVSCCSKSNPDAINIDSRCNKYLHTVNSSVN